VLLFAAVAAEAQTLPTIVTNQQLQSQWQAGSTAGYWNQNQYLVNDRNYVAYPAGGPTLIAETGVNTGGYGVGSASYPQPNYSRPNYPQPNARTGSVQPSSQPYASTGNYAQPPQANDFVIESSTYQDIRGVEFGADAAFFHRDFGFGGDIASSGRVWLGYQFNPISSVRARMWWHEYDSQTVLLEETLNLFLLPISGQSRQEIIQTEIECRKLDFEYRHASRIGMVDFEGFLGVTYAELQAEASAFLSQIDTGNGTINRQDLLQSFDFQHIGFRFGFDSVIPLPRTPRFGIVANLNGAVLGGSNDTTIDVSTQIFQAVGGGLVLTDTDAFSAPATGGNAMWIGHAQVGLQYSCPLAGCGGARVTARGLFEFQTWQTSDITFNTPTQGPQSTGGFTNELIGFSFGVGLER
jgi:hypothetical protein